MYGTFSEVGRIEHMEEVKFIKCFEVPRILYYFTQLCLV